MSITKLSIKTNEINSQRLGYIGLSLTNLLNSSEPLIASGSVIEVGGSVYEVDSNTDIDPDTNLSGISNGNMIWAYIDASTLKSVVTITEPVWSEEKQAWYDATETYRYYMCMFKDSSGNYINKQIVGGRFWSPEIYITSAYTVSDEFVYMRIIQDSSASSALTVTLPTLADNIGKKIRIENRSTTYQCNIDGEGAETIESSFTIINISTEYTILEGTSSTWKRTGYSPNRPVYQLENRKTSTSTDGGTATSGSRQTAILNYESVTDIFGASLSSNDFTLPAGEYEILSIHPFHATNYTKSYLYNVSDASDERYGSEAFCTATYIGDFSSKIKGKFLITDAKTFRIQYRCSQTQPVDGLGVGNNWSEYPAIHLQVILRKLI